MAKVTFERVSEMVDEDVSLGTLKNQYTSEEIWELLEKKDQDLDDEDLFNALMDVMYATRPKGVL